MADNYNSYNIIWISAIIIAIAILLSSNSIKVVYDSAVPLDDYGVETSIQDYNGRAISFFLTLELAKTTLAENVTKMSKQVNVTDSTGCLVGDAIDVWDEDNYFQGIITSVSGNIINFISFIDNDFSTTNTIVKCGEWNMNVDGSTYTKVFYINPPMNKSWDVESIAMKFADNADWDINTFGSRTTLTNGFTVNIENGEYQELFLIYNNGGFALRGGEVKNFAKAPSGLYGFIVDMEFATKYGAIPALHGYNNDTLTARINDDLTSQTEIAFTIRGHYKDE